MGSISKTQYIEMLDRTQRNVHRQPTNTPDEREVGSTGLHAKIEDWCAKQWPPWKIIKCRTDKRSTIALGAHDMTVYAPGGRVFNIECKALDRKPSKDQRIWSKELEMLGHTVHVVRNLDQFLNLVLQVSANQSSSSGG